MAPRKKPLPPVEEPPAVTIANLRRGLAEIAGYPLPTYTFDGTKYVPLLNANALRTMAQTLLDGGSL